MIKNPKIRPMLLIFLFLFLGISLAHTIFSRNFYVMIPIILLVIALFVLCFYSKIFFLTSFVIFCFGISIFSLSYSNFISHKFISDGVVVGRVSDISSDKEYSCGCIISDVEINGKKSGNIYLRITKDINTELEIGNFISFESNLERVNLFSFYFSNVTYSRNNVVYSAQVKLSQLEFGDNRLKFDEKVRLKVKNLLFGNISEDNVGVFYALMFGDRSFVSIAIKNMFNSSNVLHIFAVSGLHISFLVIVLNFILKKLRCNNIANFIITLVILLFYAYLCGFAPSVIRAVIMALCLSLSYLLSRRYDSLSALSFAGIISLLISPMFAFDIGFLMSYACVFAILFLNKFIFSFFKNIFPAKIAGMFAVSISAQVGITPFISFMGGYFNFLSPIINVIIIPIFSVLYPFVFLSVLIVSVFPFMSYLLTIAQFCLDIVMMIISFFANTSLSFLLVSFSPFVIILGFLLLLMISKYVKFDKKFKATFIAIVITVFSVSYVFASNIPVPMISYSSNYYSDSLVLVNSSNHVVVIDPNNSIEDILSHNRISSVDMFIFVENDSLDEDLNRKYKPNYIFTYNLRMNNDNSFCVGVKHFNMYDYSFEYLTFDMEFLGLLIKFDDTSIFFAYSSRLNEENCAIIDSLGCDFVVVGKNTNVCSYFEISKPISIYRDNKNLALSYAEYGDFYIDLKNNKYFIRSYD